MNTDALTESDLMWAERRVLEIQTKLHRWAARIVPAGLTMCSIWSRTPTSCLWHGNGSDEQASPVVDEAALVTQLSAFDEFGGFGHAGVEVGV